MRQLEVPNFAGPNTAEMAQVSRFLSDAEYQLIQNNIVIGCTDVLIVDAATGEALSSFRQQKPQEGYWFSCGGRMKRGQSYQAAGADKVRGELGLEIDPARLELLTAYSTSFNERAQEPSEEGVHTSNAAVVLFVTPEERAAITAKLELNEEHERSDWVALDEIMHQDDDFPPILQDAVQRVGRVIFQEYMHHTFPEIMPDVSARSSFTYEAAGVPEEDFVVQEGHVYFQAETKGTDYDNEPFATRVQGHTGGEPVAGRASQSGADFWFKRLEGVDLAPGESRDITTYLLGIPVITTLTNEGGVAEVQIGSNLPEELVTDALAIQKLFNSPRDFPTSLEIYKRMVIEQQIRRHLLQAENNAAAPEQVVAVPEIPPATPTPEGMTSEEFQAHRMLAFINGRFEHFTDAVVTMPNFYPDGYDQILFFQTSDGGTIELKRTYRRESDENPTDFYINVYGPDVQDFHPALRAYTGYTVSDFVQTPPAGGFANPEWPDGDFDQRFDETLQFAQDIISESPMAADEAASLIQYRTTVMRSMSAFMNRFNGGSSAEFRQARVNYAARRTAAINGAEGTVPVLEPVEQDLNVARIPLAEVIVDDLPLAGIDDVGVKAQIAQLLEAHQASAESAHLLSWNGGMVPRGAVVNGQEIAGMQNGQVVATDGSMIGTYARVVTPKGDSLRNEVLVFITRNPS